MTNASTSRRRARSKTKASPLSKSPSPGNTLPAEAFPIVAIGASAGGLEALTLLLEHLEADLGFAYVIVEHLDPHHKSMLVELLARQTTLPVEEVLGTIPVAKNRIYVIPPNRNLYLEDGKLRLASRGSSPARHMPIDYLFRTVGLERPGNCIGIVLSGTGSDGSLGIAEIKAAGGITFAQEPDSARHDGMPRSAIGTGQVDYVLPPDGIARELARIARHPFTNGRSLSSHSEEDQLRRIFTMLRTRTSVDFRHYKQNTIKRRIFRRMALLKIDQVGQYLHVLLDNQKEIEALYQDLLIKVTCFFREPASFKILREHVFPVLVRNRLPQEPIRIWVPGCSSGEEVYSIAIALLEYLGDKGGGAPLQIFGTDISDLALERARAGLYIENIALDVSPARLRRWFVRVDRGYQISKQIREMCVFARQNITSDPPFSRLDLISCRNLLIYLDAVFQARVMPIFHYALKPHGFLMLGSSESVGSHGDFFRPLDKSARIYGKKMPGPVSGVSFARRMEEHPREEPLPMVETRRAPDVQLAADHFILRYAPAGVIIDDDFKIVHFRGATGDYLEPAPGRASLHLLKMARGTLSHEIRSLVQQARSSGRPVRKESIPFKSGRTHRDLALEVAPLRDDAAHGRHFLVLFEESPAPAAVESPEPAPPAAAPPGPAGAEAGELRRELAAAQRHLQSTIEDSEATTEELKSANEEIMSSNEELQSTNEELETAKEELQSANEELTTVNDEVQARNHELSLLNNDLANFLDSVNVPVVMLDHELKIRRFTPVTQRVFNLIPTDIGRPFGDIKPKVHLPHLERLVAHVIDTVTVHEQEVVDSDGRYYHLSIRPYRTPENKIDGAVLVFVDIDTVKRASLHLEESKNYAEAIVEAVLDPLLVLDADFMIQRANSAYYRLFRTDAPHTENRSLFALDKSQWDLPAIRRLLRATFQRRRMPPVEVTETFPRIGERTLLVTSRPLARRNGQRPLILLTMADITARRRAEDERENLRRQFEQERILFEAVLRQLGVGVAIFGAPNGRLILANEGLHKVLKRRLPASAHVSLFRKIRATHALDGGRPALGWPMERTLAKGESVLYQEVTLNRPRVSERTALQVSSSPVYDAANRMIAVVALFQDITERKRTKEQLIEVSAREQRRISHDLHDGLGQELAAVGYRIKALQARLARTHSAEADEAGKIGALAEIVLGHTRDLVRFVQPVALDARGLMRSLKDLALSSSRSFRVACTFSCPRPVTLASQDLANNVFRIAQEAVHNAIRHGKPRHIAISLARRSRGLVELSVINDGANFHLPGRLQKRGLGLHIMSYRANLMGGELTVKKHAPRGTVVKCLFPAKATL